MKILAGTILLILSRCCVGSASLAAAACRSVPGSSHWPPAANWDQLNSDLGGRLLTPSPPALVCDASRPSTYNQSQCDIVETQWFNETFLTNDPVSIHYPNWQNDACVPTAIPGASAQCDTRPFPNYVVDAATAEHVVTAVKFASNNSVRVSIKGTGHDFLGRNTGPGMAIWTHNIRGITVLPSFQPSGCNGCQTESAMVVSAGHFNCEIYAEAQKYGVVPVVGFGSGVGIGGFLTGGGHSPISGKYGLSVDNALEMMVVTPAGDLVVANGYQNQDLFWAMKGGGGSTFGVLVSATLKTFPEFPVTRVLVQFQSTSVEATQNNNSNWYTTLASFHSQIPRLTDNNIFGYYGFDMPSSGVSSPMIFTFTGWALDVPKAGVDKLMGPIAARLASQPGIVGSVTTKQMSSVYQIFSPCGVVQAATKPGYNRLLGSRLWDKAAVTNQTGLINAIRSLDSVTVTGLMVAGPGVRDPTKANKTSVTPAWRRTYLHISVSTTFDYGNATQKAQKTFDMTNKQTAALRNYAPNMGSYINEADAFEPNHQQSFWGTNYQRLLGLKRKLDPKGVFWCSVCVGSEDWKLNTDTLEQCRVS